MPGSVPTGTKLTEAGSRPAAVISDATCGRVSFGSATVLPTRSAKVLMGFDFSDMIAPGAFCMIAAKAFTGMPAMRARTTPSTSPSVIIACPEASTEVVSVPGPPGRKSASIPSAAK